MFAAFVVIYLLQRSKLISNQELVKNFEHSNYRYNENQSFKPKSWIKLRFMLFIIIKGMKNSWKTNLFWLLMLHFLPVCECPVSIKTGSGDSGTNPHICLSLPPVIMRPFGKLLDFGSTPMDTT